MTDGHGNKQDQARDREEERVYWERQLELGGISGVIWKYSAGGNSLESMRFVLLTRCPLVMVAHNLWELPINDWPNLRPRPQ